MSKPGTHSKSWATDHARNVVRLRYWTVAWLATTAVAAFGPRLIWNFDTLLTILGVLANLGVGFGMILSTKRHLSGLDEMHQKIFLDAGALSLGVGLVCGLSYELWEDINLISFEPEISHLVILMCLTFVAGMIAGHRKYR
ncbi:MAG: hypothetical protein IIA08_01120 [Proteobacteria bacterium]|nr:hypothetical protein [Pseudomonadota bacterium]